MFEQLAQARYLDLVTYRRAGQGVHTPVWFAVENGSYVVFSAGDAGKVKRLRNSSRAMVARCDARGKVTGDHVEVAAALVTAPDECARAYAALRKKYGWQMILTNLFSRIAGRINQRAVIRINLASKEP